MSCCCCDQTCIKERISSVAVVDVSANQNKWTVSVGNHRSHESDYERCDSQGFVFIFLLKFRTLLTFFKSNWILSNRIASHRIEIKSMKTKISANQTTHLLNLLRLDSRFANIGLDLQTLVARQTTTTFLPRVTLDCLRQSNSFGINFLALVESVAVSLVFATLLPLFVWRVAGILNHN